MIEGLPIILPRYPRIQLELADLPPVEVATPFDLWFHFRRLLNLQNVEPAPELRTLIGLDTFLATAREHGLIHHEFYHRNLRTKRNHKFAFTLRPVP